ncbi:hypothetical protein JHK87_048516 [Glycine soja]|nr:hypothetical protein JHK87_048516 [Glycine soja]
MNTIGVMIMIMSMLGFAQANNYNPPFVQVESISETNRLTCPQACRVQCAALAPVEPWYDKCVKECTANCKHNVSVAKDCFTSCALIKSININNDVRDLSTNIVMNSCLQECQNKK